ncbi:T. brucei spp.-specific protein [Trypanosoma brucei gambiense DAL972]|uniref:T. brucei spp.-specific protein n=2 Tax=Trypanosoma brucei TaxID=5691 RepID=D0A478_TRYB9|nr:T. brucei spp.-specific protein [Trypanosoma brucei gambiense DAL972]RHW69420.1 hypothetical protein DPX39_100102700 [Trypanosoma brucei equiperdum]CBH16072.1 T. brucei spp.-specific protein [Trypanosoma brucei gambiense DAL972]|eukprot:XP_011778336.1 T. brucei spp.-specific protein [Trypanosoma brucei gambiense DAL972]
MLAQRGYVGRVTHLPFDRPYLVPFTFGWGSHHSTHPALRSEIFLFRNLWLPPSLPYILLPRVGLGILLVVFSVFWMAAVSQHRPFPVARHSAVLDPSIFSRVTVAPSFSWRGCAPQGTIWPPDGALFWHQRSMAKSVSELPLLTNCLTNGEWLSLFRFHGCLLLPALRVGRFIRLPFLK